MSSICFLTTSLSLSGVLLIGITLGSSVVRITCLMDLALPNSFKFSVKSEKCVIKRFFKFSLCVAGTPSKLYCGDSTTLIELTGNGDIVIFFQFIILFITNASFTRVYYDFVGC